MSWTAYEQPADYDAAPHDGQFYIVCTRNIRGTPSRRVEIARFVSRYTGWKTWPVGLLGSRRITHWMEQPDLPSLKGAQDGKD